MVKFNNDVFVSLSAPSTGSVLGQLPSANVTITFNEQPAGALDRNHNPNDVSFTSPPHILLPGANNPVYAALVQPDNKTVFSGDFTAYDTVPRNRVARMNADGSLDTGFLASPNSGADGVVTCLALQANNSIIIGGAFSSFNGTNRYSIARLNPNGSLDLSFNPGLGVNGIVLSTLVQPADGKVLIAGNFTLVNSLNRTNIARLNADGSVDTNFDPGIGPNDGINSMALQSDGKIVIGGDFTAVDGLNYNYVARLNSDGTLDTNFNISVGPDNSVFAVAIQANGGILIGGSFENVNQVGRNSIARLNTDGSLDLGFNPGSGFDDTVNVITLQPDQNILVGGIFTSYNSTRRIGLARLLPSGVLDTSFLDTAYNQFAGVVKDYHNAAFQPNNYLSAIAVQADGNIIIGGSFYQLGGETNRDRLFFARDAVGPRLNIARLIGGSTPGPGSIGLANNLYTADKFGGQSYVTLTRNNGALGPASVTFAPSPQPAGSGAAVPGADYTSTVYNPIWSTTWPGPPSTWDFADSYTGPNNNASDDLVPPAKFADLGGAYVNVLNNSNSVGNLQLNLTISQPQSSDIFFLGGENIPIGVALDTNTVAPLTIVDNTLDHGVLSFSSPTFTVLENATNATITVIRTNGTDSRVTVTAATTTGGTALPGPNNDYTPVTKTLFFESGQTSTNFTIPIVNGNVLGPDKTVNLVLSNPTGGATIGLTNAVLTIINDNFASGHLHFTATNYTAQETDGTANISVARIGGSQNIISVTAIARNGTASNGVNFGAATNTLTWNAGDVSVKSFPVSVIHDGLVTPNLTVNLSLTNAVVGGVTNNANGLGTPTNATLTIVNDDFFGRPTFSASTYSVNNNAGFATITINRLGGSAQAISVNYATVNGTGANPAFAGLDYTTTSGTFVFNPGEFSKAFTVPITPKNTAVGNLNFGVVLSAPAPAGVILGIRLRHGDDH